MQVLSIICGLFGITVAVFASPGQSCGTPPAAPNQPWRIDAAVAFKTQGLAVDADGAPNSYLVDGNGLSDTCDGVVAIVDGQRITDKNDPQHWYSTCQKAWAAAIASGDFSHVSIFGFLTDAQHRPVIQSAGDPFPGKAYVTTTTLTVPDTPDRVQRHWVDAVKVPYIVLPTGPFRKNYGVKPGDIAIVYRPKTGATASAVFGDCCGLGEASIKLHRDLGNEPITNKHGVARANRGMDDAVFTLVFPGINVPGSLDAESWNKSIRASGDAALKNFGGRDRLAACAK